VNTPLRLPPALARHFAVATFLCAIPLIAFGGSITTLGAGMAVEGWWDAEGHFMPFFPLEKWFRDLGTFVEHTHRLFGMLVGLLAIGTVVVDLVKRAPARRTAMAFAALVAVSIQGAIGGFRVLENSPALAELHGLVAQIVFALLGLNALVHSRRWVTCDGVAPAAPRALALGVAALVFVQITVGVYYRHDLRPVPLEDITWLLHLHLGLAVVVLAAVVVLGRQLASAASRATGGAARVLRAQKARLHALLGVQITLGLIAWLSHSADEPERVTKPLLVSSFLHVTFGALLLAAAAVAVAWTHRARRGPEAGP